MGMASDPISETYFRLERHRPVIAAHIILMVLAWVVILPIAVMLSVANSRFRLSVQFVFTITNVIGVIAGEIYSHKTSDLYPNQKHSAVGWFGTVFTLVWLSMALAPTAGDEKCEFIQGFQDDRRSYEALLPSSSSSSFELEQDDRDGVKIDSALVDGDDTDEKIGNSSRFNKMTTHIIFSRAIAWMASKSPLRIVHVLRAILDRAIMVLGFVCIVTGIVVFSGAFRGRNVFNGLAHSIKGGIFFWYGLLTFGRWLGCLADVGWAWNLRPDQEVVGRIAASMPTMEFIESAAMCFYGVTNVWLEHLSNPGGTWEPRDLEHVSIALLFFGGGLIGMLINSISMRDLAIVHLRLRLRREINRNEEAVPGAAQSQRHAETPLNPMPAILVFLLGFLMSSHHQASEISSMLHMLWGKAFMAGTLARLATYATVFLRPLTSFIPQRPPTEVITSFCMIAGGLLLMLSNTDTMEALEYHDLDAMFVFTNALALTAILMSWVAICLAIKGWGEQKEALSPVEILLP